jgi:protein-tyrosine phosphatase
MGSVALRRPTATSLTFTITYSASYGDRVYVVGSAPELGSWDLPSALPLKWHPQHIWSATLSFTAPYAGAPTRFEYKFFVAPSAAPSSSPLWESGPNHATDLATGTPAAVLAHRWSDGMSHDILPSQVPPPPSKAGVPTGTPAPGACSPGQLVAPSPPPTPAYRPAPGAPADPVSLAAARLASAAEDDLATIVMRIRVPRSISGHAEHAVYVVGSLPALGSWNKAHSPRLRTIQLGRGHGRAGGDVTRSGLEADIDADPLVDTLGEHELWEVRITLPREALDTEFKYKYLVRRGSEGERCWEPGPNRRAVIRHDAKSLVLDDSWDKLRCVFSIFYPTAPGGVMHITGDPVEIGGWFRPGPKAMRLGSLEKIETEVDGRKWRITVWLPRNVTSFSYRYAIISPGTKTSLWEREPNRRADFASYDAKEQAMNARRMADTAGSSSSVVLGGSSSAAKLGHDGRSNGIARDENSNDGEYMPDNSVRFLRDVNFVASMQFDHVPPKMIIGPYPQNAADIDALADAGATAVFNVQTDEDFAHRGINWPVLVERYSARNVRVVRFPIRDFDPTSLCDHLHGAAHQLHDLIQQGHTVYIHCTAGMGRAPAVAVGYLCWVRGYSLDDAVAHVKKHRPVAVPNVNVLRRALERLF